MDPSHWTTPKSLAFSPAGKYLMDFPPEFPIRVCFYDFSLPHPAIPNNHDHLEINYIYKGSGNFVIGGRAYSAEQGDVFIINRAVFHLLEAGDPENFGTLAIYFMPALIHEPGMSDRDLEYLMLFQDCTQGFNPKVALSPESSREVLQLIDSISEELWGQREFYRIAAKNLLCQILLILNRSAKVQYGRIGEFHLRPRDMGRLKPLFDSVQKHYSQKLTLRELAQVSKMSVTYLCRYFKKVTGKTITEYITRYRIDRAKEMLIEDERSITWIASEVGFESHSYFDRVFHEVTRMTPHEFRNRFAPRVRVDLS
jgi:AraC-like DNA-binding protein